MVSFGFPAMSAFISMAMCLGKTDNNRRSWKQITPYLLNLLHSEWPKLNN